MTKLSIPITEAEASVSIDRLLFFFAERYGVRLSGSGANGKANFFRGWLSLVAAMSPLSRRNVLRCFFHVYTHDLTGLRSAGTFLIIYLTSLPAKNTGVCFSEIFQRGILVRAYF